MRKNRAELYTKANPYSKLTVFTKRLLRREIGEVTKANGTAFEMKTLLKRCFFSPVSPSRDRKISLKSEACRLSFMNGALVEMIGTASCDLLLYSS